MVCKIIPGDSFRRAVNYNENKVADGEASFLGAGNYPVDDARLTFSQKLEVLEKRGALKPNMKMKVQHIVLAFSPEDQLTDERLQEIAHEYMGAIGFGEQPYLVYCHHDTRHPHLHLVTTHIDEDGERMDTFRIGKYKSEPARKALEEKYGLLRAEDQPKQKAYLPDAIDIEALQYGKVPVHATVSRIVRHVVKQYQFASLSELNAALRQFNIMADRGAKDSAMYLNKGLVYSLIDSRGTRIGRPIKASTIFSKPTLPTLEAAFDRKGKAKTLRHRTRLKSEIERALQEASGDRQRFTKALRDKNIYALFRENEEGRVYGITFVDNEAKVVYNGRDIDKTCSAQSILGRLSGTYKQDLLSNKVFTRRTLAKTEYTKGFEPVLTSWIQSGMLVYGFKAADGEALFRMGYALSDASTYVPVDKKMALYFLANGFTPERAAWLHERLQEEYRSNALHEILSIPAAIIASIVREMMQVTPAANSSLDPNWRRSARRNRRRRRRY